MGRWGTHFSIVAGPLTHGSPAGHHKMVLKPTTIFVDQALSLTVLLTICMYVTCKTCTCICIYKLMYMSRNIYIYIQFHKTVCVHICIYAEDTV